MFPGFPRHAGFAHSEAFTGDEVSMYSGWRACEPSRFLAGEGRDWTPVLDGGDATLWMSMSAIARRTG
jgi:hypothetical protein